MSAADPAPVMSDLGLPATLDQQYNWPSLADEAGLRLSSTSITDQISLHIVSDQHSSIQISIETHSLVESELMLKSSSEETVGLGRVHLPRQLVVQKLVTAQIKMHKSRSVGAGRPQMRF